MKITVSMIMEHYGITGTLETGQKATYNTERSHSRRVRWGQTEIIQHDFTFVGLTKKARWDIYRSKHLTVVILCS